MVELRCLGPVELRVDGRAPPAELLWRKHLALLVYLVRSPRGRARDHLIGMFWPEKDDARARHSLNEAMRVLRRALGDALVTEGDVVRLQPGSVRSDLDDPPGQAGVFLEGLTLSDAPAFEDWVARERATLRAETLRTLSESGEHALAVGDTHVAADAARQALALDDQHEPSVRLLMRASALAGDRAGALEAFAGWRERTLRELGAVPAAETVALAEHIRQTGTGRRRAEVPVLAPAVPLVGPGRRILARLLEVWASGASGCRVVVLRGDPGTGKTRLADELAARAGLDGAVVCLARAVEQDDMSLLLGAWVRGGLMGAELGGASPEALAGLAVLEPDVAARFPGARAASPLAPLESLAAVLASVAEERSVLLVLDDADRAHPDVVRFPVALAQRSPRARCLTLVTSARPGSPAVDDVTARLGRDLAGVALETAPLTEPDIASLVAWALPTYDAEARDRLVRRVMVDTAGNPFLAVEVIRAVRDGLAPGPSAGEAWPAAHRTLDDTLPADLPPMVVAALRQRYRALSAQAQRALAAVAVLGGRAGRENVARGAQLPPDALDQALDELEWERWLAGDASGYVFVTRLAQEVILSEMITGGERRRIRERAAGG